MGGGAVSDIAPDATDPEGVFIHSQSIPPPL